MVMHKFLELMEEWLDLNQRQHFSKSQMEIVTSLDIVI
jgi:hypothetical protein